jgi:hypothetical protein
VLDAHVDWDHIGGDSFVRFGLCVVYDPHCWVRCRSGIREFGREKTISTASVCCELFSGSIAGLMLVHLEGLQTVNNYIGSVAQRIPNSHSRQRPPPGRLSPEEAKHSHRWGSQSQGREIATREELSCQWVDRGMSSRKDVDRERFWVRQVDILLLCLDEVAGV